jgi:hypothetical protein
MRNTAWLWALLSCIVLAGASASVVGVAMVQRNGPRDFVVATTGSGSNAGSASSPWDLATALSHPAALRPGDRIWIRGGTYRGSYTSRLTGTAEAPIIVRGYPGERVTLDGIGSSATTLTIRGGWTWYRDFEVMDSDPVRRTNVAGSHPANLERGDGIGLFGPHTKLINLVVHDAADGIGVWSDATDAEVYGCLVYNNGWIGPDRAHGQGLYIQNESGTKRISEVISFNNFSTGMKAYAESIGVSNVQFRGIVSFNNGSLAAGTSVTREPNIFVGTTRHAASRIEVSDSVLYYPPDTETGANLDLGYTANENQQIVVRGNHMVGGNRSMRMLRWRGASISNNLFYAATVGSFPQRLVTLELSGDSPQEYSWDGNTYVIGGASPPFIYQGRTTTFAGWRQSSGFDGQSTFTTGRPSGVQVIVRPNAYQGGRANVIVLNWDQRSEVSVDLSSVGLHAGQEFEIRDAQDFYGGAVVSTTWTGSPLTLPMRARGSVGAIGNIPASVPHTSPQFAVFVVLPTRYAVPR